MKRLLLLGLIGFYLPAGTALAVPNGKVVGVVAGTAAGLIVANNVHGVNPWVAAPVGALLGGYIGSRYDHRDRYRDYRYDNYRNDRHYDRRDSHRDRDHYYGHGDRHDYRYLPVPMPQPTAIYVETPAPKPAAPTPQVADPQPGVDLIKIPILNSNGIRTDVSLLRIKGRFVGPQGEYYDTLPTSGQLAKRYGM